MVLGLRRGQAGLLRLVGQFHAELDGTGVHAFGLQPGLVRTPTTAALAEDPEKSRWLPNSGQRSRDDYGTGEPAGEMLVRIASRDADQLSGLLFGAWDDLAELCGRVDELRADQQRTLRVNRPCRGVLVRWPLTVGLEVQPRPEPRHALDLSAVLWVPRTASRSVSSRCRSGSCIGRFAHVGCRRVSGGMP